MSHKKETVLKVFYNVILSVVEESIDLKYRCFDFAQHDNKTGEATFNSGLFQKIFWF